MVKSFEDVWNMGAEIQFVYAHGRLYVSVRPNRHSQQAEGKAVLASNNYQRIKKARLTAWLFHLYV